MNCPLTIIRRSKLEELQTTITELERKNAVLLDCIFRDVKENFSAYQNAVRLLDQNGMARYWGLAKKMLMRMKHIGLEPEAQKIIKDIGTTRKILLK